MIFPGQFGTGHGKNIFKNDKADFSQKNTPDGNRTHISRVGVCYRIH